MANLVQIVIVIVIVKFISLRFESRNFFLAGERDHVTWFCAWRDLTYRSVLVSFQVPKQLFSFTMASRYGSHLTQREGRSSLFSSYDNRQASQSPSKSRPGSGYSSRYGGDASANQSASAFGAYPNGGPSASAASQFRTATPDSKGRYSDAVLSELESQNDEHISGILGKVGQLKQVSSDEYRLNTAHIPTN